MDRRVVVGAAGVAAVIAVVAASIAWVAEPLAPPKQLALVLADSTHQSEMLAAGARAAANICGVELLVLAPGIDANETAQDRLIARARREGAEGVVFEPARPGDQTALVDDLSTSMHVVLCRADAPTSQRRSFVGAGGYATGRVAAEAVRQLAPDGGAVVAVFNDRSPEELLRRDGLVESLNAGKAPQAARGWSVVAEIGGHDSGDVGDSLWREIVRDPDVACVVCLGANSSRLVAAALDGRRDGVKIVAIDSTDDALRRLELGQIDATVAVNPYQIGYAAVTQLAALCRYSANELPRPGRGSVFVRPHIVTRETLADVPCSQACCEALAGN